MTKKALVRELSGRTGLTEKQITKVLTELRSLTNKSTSKTSNGKVHVISGYQGVKLRFTKKEALASVHRRPTFAELISELEKD